MWNRPLERTKVISLRLTPKEHKLLLAEARRTYMPLSVFIRHRLFGEPSITSGKRRSKGK